MEIIVGTAVSSEYFEARKHASEVARARNSLLDNATKAYVSGSKQLAKDLSLQGHLLNIEMKELHSKV